MRKLGCPWAWFWNLAANRKRLFLLRKFFPQFARALDCRAGTEVLQLAQLANLDLAFLEGDAFSPVDRFVLRIYLDQPEAADQLLGLGEGPVDHGALCPRELDTRAL